MAGGAVRERGAPANEAGGRTPPQPSGNGEASNYSGGDLYGRAREKCVQRERERARAGEGGRSEDDGVEHLAEGLEQILTHEAVDILFEVALRIELADVLDGALLGRELVLVGDLAGVLTGQVE